MFNPAGLVVHNTHLASPPLSLPLSLYPPDDELTVGKVYAALMIFDYYKENRAKKLPPQPSPGGPQVKPHAALIDQVPLCCILQGKMGAFFKPMVPLATAQDVPPKLGNAQLTPTLPQPQSEAQPEPQPEATPTTTALTNGGAVKDQDSTITESPFRDVEKSQEVQRPKSKRTVQRGQSEEVPSTAKAKVLITQHSQS
ncbi:hypothetical protein JZ751_028910 [Albula glossodonta]|uniref:Voltage-dependent calcium channel alpha-1 subunit IQ domain-containing protein n=1 Tax=Albula glossodonta TaxID=121402 RepID=A0A8T2NI47_9TELE|nr:hypothetical protein JZ751_028910 [Albula glossodonta]